MTPVRSSGPIAWQTDDVERVLGIGGYFIRAADPLALNAWYRDCLGLDADDHGVSTNARAAAREGEREVVEETQEAEGIGRFGWVTDPEGNRVGNSGSPPERNASCGIVVADEEGIVVVPIARREQVLSDARAGTPRRR